MITPDSLGVTFSICIDPLWGLFSNTPPSSLNSSFKPVNLVRIKPLHWSLMWWACCQYWPIHCEWANLPLTWPAMRVIARIKKGRYTHEYTKHSVARADLKRQPRENYWGLRCATRIEIRLTGSSDMKRLIVQCLWPWWQMMLLHLEPLWIY